MSSLHLCLQLFQLGSSQACMSTELAASPSPQSPNLLGRWLQRETEHKPGPTAKAGPRALASKVILSETSGESATRSPCQGWGRSLSRSSGVRKHRHRTKPKLRGMWGPLRPALSLLSSSSSRITTNSRHPPLTTPLCLLSHVLLPGMRFPTSLPLAASCSPVRSQLRYRLLQEALPDHHVAWLSCSGLP